MGGLGPGIGGLEYLVIAAVALIVVGPERLPAMLRQLGKWVAKMRGMANEFRASFEDMARQSELDDLRKEVEALRTGQGAMGQGMVRLGDEANAAFKDIKSELEKTDRVEAPPAAVTLGQPEFPEPSTPPVVEAPTTSAVVSKPRKPRTKVSSPATATVAVKAPKPRAPRKPKATA